jgi:hypothetical protein
VVSSPDIATAIQRLGDLPVVWDGAVSFSTIEVSAFALSLKESTCSYSCAPYLAAASQG